ncbi:MAG: TIGR01777 family oxidoreductase [Bacteroidetes bacterium]|nr:TIGR01777 family oxidoreductase [Bacteroidota bacterium]
MATILITGGTGMTGRALSSLLVSKGHEVIVLTRDAARASASEKKAGISYASWNVPDQIIDVAAVEKADYIVHLAGAGVADKRWSVKRKKEIVDSRVKSGELIVKTLKENRNKVKAILCASGIGWYGPDPEIPNPRPFVEADKPFNDFLGETCRLWEAAIMPASGLGKRVVIFRTGIVLSNGGGALAEFKKPLRAGIATVLGSGAQMVSWVHIDDLCRMYLKAIEEHTMEGVYNAVSPKPVNNKALVLELAKAMRGRFYLPMPVPSFLLKLVLGEMSIEVLKSATVNANKIRTAGFDFLYPTIQAAINALIHPNPSPRPPKGGEEA